MNLNFDASKFTGSQETQAAEDMPLRSSGVAQTDWVIPKSTFTAQNHDWVQRGYEISCTSCPMNHGAYLPVGKMIVGSRGNWEVIDEPITR